MKLIKYLLMFLLVGTMIFNTSCSSDFLVVYTEVGFEPFEYIDKGKIVGVDVDIMNKVGERLGKKVFFENINLQF